MQHKTSTFIAIHVQVPIPVYGLPDNLKSYLLCNYQK